MVGRWPAPVVGCRWVHTTNVRSGWEALGREDCQTHCWVLRQQARSLLPFGVGDTVPLGVVGVVVASPVLVVGCGV
jgi:hypothetical protein